jgi:ribosomal protein L37AE/L43A
MQKVKAGRFLVNGKMLTRGEILKLPIEKRREIMREQAEKAMPKKVIRKRATMKLAGDTAVLWLCGECAAHNLHSIDSDIFECIGCGYSLYAIARRQPFYVEAKPCRKK